MKKIITLIACLSMGVSSIAMGATFEIVDGGSCLVGVDRQSKEIRLVRGGTFTYDQGTGRFGNQEVDLLAWQGGVQKRWGIDLERLRHETTVATTCIELRGNISSGMSVPIGGEFQITQRVFDNSNTSHDIVFNFKRIIGTDAEIKFNMLLV